MVQGIFLIGFHNNRLYLMSFSGRPVAVDWSIPKDVFLAATKKNVKKGIGTCILIPWKSNFIADQIHENIR